MAVNSSASGVVAGEERGGGDGARVGDEIGVEGGAVAVAGDGFLHGVAGVDGPEEAVGVLLGALPVVVDADELGEE